MWGTVPEVQKGSSPELRRELGRERRGLTQGRWRRTTLTTFGESETIFDLLRPMFNTTQANVKCHSGHSTHVRTHACISCAIDQSKAAATSPRYLQKLSPLPRWESSQSAPPTNCCMQWVEARAHSHTRWWKKNKIKKTFSATSIPSNQSKANYGVSTVLF